MNALQILAVEQRQPLAGIENERDAGRGELRGMLHHAVPPVRRHDAERDVARVGHLGSGANAAWRPGETP